MTQAQNKTITVVESGGGRAGVLGMGMPCVRCGGNTRVLDSRGTAGGKEIRRRRRCLACSTRFTTYEAPTIAPTYTTHDVEVVTGQLNAAVEAARAAVAALSDMRDYVLRVRDPNADEALASLAEKARGLA